MVGKYKISIRRDIYLTRLISRKQNGLIKIITGIRRCGKSYLLNTIFYNHLLESGVDASHIIRFAFDSAFDLEAIGEDYLDPAVIKHGVDPRKFMQFIMTQLKDSEQYYLLLDEVQNMRGFETVLNGLLRKENVDIYVTGSNSRSLSTDV
ncbi:MAG TPA: AAA family ATPase, partial [Methanocorpusculum sp.]|nr:AAA family ATPase [Methanocorpusculum sp.]